MRAVYGIAARLVRPTPPAPQPAAARPTAYTPIVSSAYVGNVAGLFAGTPSGVILHGSRSGVAGNPIGAEFAGTCHWAAVEPDGLGWNATIGDDALALHMALAAWGWNARGCSPHFLGVEFAQPTVADPISDGQVRAFCHFFGLARHTWPALPRYLPTHAELDGTSQYGVYDGKTDVYPKGDARTIELRVRIAARLDELGL